MSVKEGDLRVWFIAALPAPPFCYAVPNLEVARHVLDAISFYWLHEFDRGLFPDVSTVGGIEQFEDGEWGPVEDGAR